MDLRLALVLGVVLTSLLLISNDVTAARDQFIDAKGLHVFPLICFFSIYIK
jgi:hypothetical protein